MYESQEGTGAPTGIGPCLGFNWHSGWSSYQPKALDLQQDEINLALQRLADHQIFIFLTL